MLVFIILFVYICYLVINIIFTQQIFLQKMCDSPPLETILPLIWAYILFSPPLEVPQVGRYAAAYTTVCSLKSLNSTVLSNSVRL